MPNTTNPVVGKGRAWLDGKRQSKQLKHSSLSNTTVFSKAGFTTGFDVATNSSPNEGVISAADLKRDSQSADADRRLLKTEAAAISADSTTEEVLAVRCASDLLRYRSGRGARQPDIPGPKVCHRRKQELKEMDDYDQINFDEEVGPTNGNVEDTESGKSLIGDEVFWMEMPESDEPILTSMDDEENTGSLMFVPSKTSNCQQRQNVLWTGHVQGHPSLAAFDVGLPVSPFGFESGMAVTDFDGVHDGGTPVQAASEGSFFNVHSVPKWLSDCYGGGSLPIADDKLDSQMFCNLLSEEITSMDDDEPNPDFINSLFSFSQCL